MGDEIRIDRIHRRVTAIDEAESALRELREREPGILPDDSRLLRIEENRRRARDDLRASAPEDVRVLLAAVERLSAGMEEAEARCHGGGCDPGVWCRLCDDLRWLRRRGLARRKR